MNIPEITIPDDLPDEARKLVEEVNQLLAEVTARVAELNNAPETFSIEERRGDSRTKSIRSPSLHRDSSSKRTSNN